MTTLIKSPVNGATGEIVQVDVVDRTFQAVVAGSGAVSATIVIDGSNDRDNWIVVGTISLSGTTSATDGFASTAKWKYIRSRITAISGTNASVTVTMEH